MLENKQVRRSFFSMLFRPYNKSFIDQASSVKMAGYWPRSLFTFLWTSTSSRSIKTQKENSANIQPSWPRAWSIIYTYWMHLRPTLPSSKTHCGRLFLLWISLLSKRVIWLAERTQAVRKGRHLVLYSSVCNGQIINKKQIDCVMIVTRYKVWENVTC